VFTCCSTVSGEAPQAPVASSKSGTIFEKRLIEAYIAEHGKDPVTGEELTADDLIEIKSKHYLNLRFSDHTDIVSTAARTVRPRPPTLTSIPSLLSAFQNEWDALALQVYTLQQQLSQTQQELSTALYQNDAAVRVIGRLMKERDEARDALAKVSIGASASAGGDEMQIDNQGMPEYVVEKVSQTQQAYVTPKWPPVPQLSSNVAQAFLNTQEASISRRLGNHKYSLYSPTYTHFRSVIPWCQIYSA